MPMLLDTGDTRSHDHCMLLALARDQRRQCTLLWVLTGGLSLQSCRDLDLSRNVMVDPLPRTLAHMVQLVSLKLDFNSLKDGYEVLASCTALQ
jgi:hypothetical protein